MPVYIHDDPEWPRFRWNGEKISLRLGQVRHRQGRLIGRMESLGFALRSEAGLRSLTQEVLKSSEIEGEILDTQQVRSSIARRMGLESGALGSVDRNVEAIVELMIDATANFAAPLTADRLFGWHAALFPAGRSGMARIRSGNWRDDSKGPMQVVSGPSGREKVHFQAPPAADLNKQMAAFLHWYNGNLDGDTVIRAALAHLWFVTIHPFDDGNGRIARAIADMTLARSEGSALRFYSMSAQIRLERSTYYALLERTQKGGLDVTPWLLWFLDCLERAFAGAETILASVLAKARFWEIHAGVQFNERQRAMVKRLFDGFHGKLTTSKWASIAKCSQDTALRDIEGLIERGILVKDVAGGRSTSYSLTNSIPGA